MRNRRLKIHPLFFILGCVFIFLGKAFELAIYVLTLLIHEYAHFLAAEKVGLRLGKTYLTPFGAKLFGELYKLSYKSEIFVALAGPLINGGIGIFLTALCFLFPKLTLYLELVIIANLVTAIINLIPAYPLDGGRVLYVVLRQSLGDSLAEEITSYVGVLFAIMFLVIFLKYEKFVQLFTLAGMAVFILLASVFENKVEKYKRKAFLIKKSRQESLLEIKHFTSTLDEGLLNLVKKFKTGYVAIFHIYENYEQIFCISESELIDFMQIYGVNHTAEDVGVIKGLYKFKNV